MLESILRLDRLIFSLINQSFSCDFLDSLMKLITNEKIWLPIIIMGWFYLFFGRKGKKRMLALLLVVGTGATDIISSRIIKKIVGRKRPCITEPDCRILIGRKTSKSFPSSHAANTSAFAAMIYFCEGFPSAAPFIVIAASVAYSRVYVGVHYPIDVLAGILLGIFIARIILAIALMIRAKSTKAA